MKTLKILVLLMITMLGSQASFAAERATIDYQLPEAFIAGQTVEVQWKLSNFDPKKPHYLYIQNLDTELFKRIGVGRTKTDDYIKYSWPIPENLTGEFRFRVSHQIKGQWVRRRSQTFNIKGADEVQESNQDEKEQTPKENNKPTENNSSTQLIKPEFFTTNLEPKGIAQKGLSLVGFYSFNAQYEPWDVNRLTIVNDSQNDGFDIDINESTSILNKIFVRYKNKEGQVQEKGQPLNGNRATFSNLDFYVPQDKSGQLEVWADIKDPVDIDQQESGKTFRLGLQNISSNESSFEAIGVFSNSKITNPSGFGNSGPAPREFIVRKSSPIFKITNNTSPFLVNGKNTVFSFSITPSGKSAISLGRFVFDVNQNGIGTLDEAQLMRAGNLLTNGDENNVGQVYMVWDAGSNSCFASKAQQGANTGMDCSGNTKSNAKLIITFTQEQIITEETEFKIRLNASSINPDSSIQVRLADGDDYNKPTIGGSVESTGAIFNNTGSNELFSTSSQFVNEATTITDRNIIWSDQIFSGGHQYPLFNSANNPTINSNSSTDFTNGYLLNLGQLSSSNLEN